MAPMLSRSADVEAGRGRLLDYFLVATLDGAVAFAEMNGMAMHVAEQLHLDMARLGKVFFHIDFVIAESGSCFATRQLIGLTNFASVQRDLHTLATATRRRLDEDGVADFFGHLDGLIDRLYRTVAAGNGRHAMRLDRLLGSNLVAHNADMVRRRADKGEAVLFYHLGKIGIFRHEADAGVDGVGAGDAGRRQDGGYVQITVLGRRRPDADALVRQAHMHGIGIGGRMNGDGGNTHFPAGAVDAEGDFPAIGDQDFFEHSRRLSLRSAGFRRIQPDARR